MKRLLSYVLAISILFAFGCKTQYSEKVTLIDKIELEELLLNKDIQLIDVRTIPEFEEGRINGSLNIVWDSNFSSKLSSLDHDKPVVLYCKRGGRSAKAAKVLEALEFDKIYDLDGGYDAFIK